MYAESSILLYIESLQTVPGVLGMNEVSALKLYAWANLLTLLHSNQPKLQRVLAILSANRVKSCSECNRVKISNTAISHFILGYQL